MSRIEYDLRPGKDYCGYCKADYDEQGKCNCNGRGAPVESIGECGYCHNYIFPDVGCGCDGFGHSLDDQGNAIYPKPGCDCQQCQWAEEEELDKDWQHAVKRYVEYKYKYAGLTAMEEGQA